MKTKKSPRKIVIDEDGWVWLEKRNGMLEIGLGDIGEDVVIEDNRIIKRKKK